jgi:hypothetical protein
VWRDVVLIERHPMRVIEYTVTTHDEHGARTS